MPSTRPKNDPSSPESSPTGTGPTRDSHVPAHPSGLRQSFTPASYGTVDETAHPRKNNSPPLSPSSPPLHTNDADVTSHGDPAVAGPSVRTRADPATESTSLLGRSLDFREQVHEGPCHHGSFSPRPGSPTGSGGLLDSHTDTESEGSVGTPAIDGVLGLASVEARKKSKSWPLQLTAKMKSKKMSTSSALAERHGIKDSTLMWVMILLPCLWFVGKLVVSLLTTVCAGIYPTTSRSSFGYPSTIGHTSRAILLEL